jgi:transposase
VERAVQRHGTTDAGRRRIATRCDKLAASHLALVQLAAIRMWL